MSKASLSCVLSYFAVLTLCVIFAKAQSPEPDPHLVLNSPMPLTESTRFTVPDGFNITGEFLDFYYSFFKTKTFPRSSYNELNCSAYFPSKKKENYTQTKVFKDEITKDMLHMYEIYKIEKRKCISSTSLCLRKCCKEGEVIDLSTKKCRISNISSKFSLYVFDDRLKPMLKTYGDISPSPLSSFHPLFYGIRCHDAKFTDIRGKYYIKQIGTFTLTEFESKNETGVTYNSNSFCLENFVINDNLTFKGARVCSSDGKAENVSYQDALNTMQFHFQKIRNIKYWIIGHIFVGCSISILLIVFWVYAIIPELQDTHGKNFMCYIASLIAYYIVRSVIFWPDDLSNIGCNIAGFILRILEAAIFFWLNAINIGVWETFSYRDKEHRRRIDFRFLINSCCVWGGATIMSIVTEYSPALFHNATEIKIMVCIENFRKTLEATQMWKYVVGISLLLNFILFSYTGMKIFIGQRKLKIHENKHHQWTLFFKLFITTGMFWVIQNIANSFKKPTWVISVLFYGLETIQVVFIFWIFVLNKKVKPLLKLKLGNWYQRMSQTSPTNNTNYSLSDGSPRNTNQSNETQQSELVSIDRQTDRKTV